MCFISNVMVNLKNPLTGSTTLIALHELGECGNVGGAGEVRGAESGITSLICDEQQK
jgi:hypothetical protein